MAANPTAPSAPAPPVAPAAAEPARPPRSLASDAWRQFRRHRPAVAGSVVLLVIIVATVLGPIVYQASATNLDYGSALKGPSPAHPFGADDRGRDLLARALVGGRVSVAVGLVAMLIAVT